jgi:two-component system phosphate regulon sensor histidine kinase PhoR
MLSFRQKILLSFVFVFVIFIALMVPFASNTVKKIASKAMQDRAQELIEKIQTAPNNDALIRRLKEQKPLIFFRVSVISDERKVLYDSHTKRLLGPRFSQEYVVDHPEVMEAFEKGLGYNEDYSELLGQKFSYFAKSFDFHGKTYIMRTAFPYKYVTELTQDFEIGIIAVATIILLLFSTMTWFIIQYLTKPIAQIIKAVTPYAQGQETLLPEIKINASSTDEFSRLAATLNSLSTKLRKQINTLTSERNEKEAILESLIEGVIAIDQNMIIAYANQAALKLLKRDSAELLNHHFSMVQLNQCLILLERCLHEKTALTDTIIIEKNGPKVYLDVVAAPTKDNTGAILVLQDKTSHYRILEMRKDFVANASHELKTPITIIRGFAETLHDNPDLPQTITVDITNKIVRNCQRMTKVIKDLLTLSDIENIPESRLEECNMIDIAKNCRDMVHNLHPDADVQIHDITGEGILIVADHNLMELAIMNLIENAAKYSSPPAHIDVSMELSAKWVKIEVADKGIGIPEADVEHVFEKFYTVDKAHSQKMGGSGLGLSIVKTIIEKHGGQITVASNVGEGTTFTILLPHRISH